MTLRMPKHFSGEVIPFDGTDGQRAENRLSHAWEQVPNPVQFVPIPARWVEQLSMEEAMKLAKPKKDTVAKCSQCGCRGGDRAASWPCGEAPRFTEIMW